MTPDHVSAVTDGHDGEWIVYCPACSSEVGEWVAVCKQLDPSTPWPAHVLVAKVSR